MVVSKISPLPVHDGIQHIPLPAHDNIQPLTVQDGIQHIPLPVHDSIQHIPILSMIVSNISPTCP